MSVPVQCVVFMAGGLLAAGIACASPRMPEREPGLWELRMSQDALGDMLKSAQAAMKGMPEEQRKMLEEMMAGSGVMLGQPNIIRECVTPEMVKSEFEPVIDDPGMKCSGMKWSGSASEGSYTMTCTNADGTWDIEGRIWDATSRSYKSTMTMKGTVNGQPVSTTISHEARWVGADCQGVKPRVPGQ